jgi:hypothetical protein
MVHRGRTQAAAGQELEKKLCSRFFSVDAGDFFIREEGRKHLCEPFRLFFVCGSGKAVKNRVPHADDAFRSAAGAGYVKNTAAFLQHAFREGRARCFAAGKKQEYLLTV